MKLISKRIAKLEQVRQKLQSKAICNLERRIINEAVNEETAALKKLLTNKNSN
jgi:hypothetical protein